MFKKLIKLSILIILFVSCDDSNDTKKSTLKVSLTDAPANFEEVNITFTEISVKSQDADSNGFIVLSNETQTINLLDWSNGKTTPLGEKSMEPGKYSQIRLKIQSAEVKIDGQTSTLTVPSGSQSGLKLNLHFTLEEGSTYEIVLDFDASRSVVSKGNGGYSLKPTIRAIASALSGSISGTISNIDSVQTSVVRAIQGNDIITSVYPDSTGKFMLSYLPAGTYSIRALGNDSSFVYTQSDIQVTNGSDNSVGSFELTKNQVEF